MKAIVFDADGVVCVGERFTVALERVHGIKSERMQSFFTGIFRECITGERDLREVIAPLLSDWGWRGSVEDFLGFWFQQEHLISSEVMACVRSLRKTGHPCYLGTNQEKYRTAYFRSEMGLAAEFDGIFPSCEMGAAKPSGDYFFGLQQRLKIPPAKIMLVDDTEANVLGARKAGWGAIHYQGIQDIPYIIRLAL